jgi:hypothetical protein
VIFSSKTQFLLLAKSEAQRQFFWDEFHDSIAPSPYERTSVRHVIDRLPVSSCSEHSTLPPLQQCLLIGLHTTFSYSDALQGSVPDDADYWTAPLSFCLFINTQGNLTNDLFHHHRKLS